MNIAIFGSAFNPPTQGHEDAIQNVLTSNNIDKVLLVPSYKHAFSKRMLDYSLRVEMLEHFVGDLDDKRIQALPVEQIIATAGKPIYTYDLLKYLQTHVYNDDNLHFVIGPDNDKNWDSFYKAAEIKERWSLLVVPERKQIRSTLVRESLNKGVDIDDLVTPSVKTFIEAHKLYV